MNIVDSKIIEKIMKEPVFIENSESAKKSRNVLLSLSTITIFLIYFNLSIKDDSSILGLKFNGLNENSIYIALFVIIIFNLINFFWNSYNTYNEWEIRQTGMKNFNSDFTIDFMYTDNGNSSYLSPVEPRNSTLYYWWACQSSKIQDTEKLLKELSDINNKIYDNLQLIESNQRKKIFIHENVSYTALLFQKNMESISNIEKNFEIIKSALATKNIETNLYKFDKRFKTFLYSQNLKWILLDLLFPFILSIVSIILLLCKIF
ncbi:hypothetical protein AAW30_01830 [Arcobacter porcinus]|uniref:hypothetical protein n=1 Tax=Arcobacter porcinus TaxID=1935204 RepID=UPI0008259387|nr:hypothetical protein [Arcobacter porcinus]OCL81614.1 hypothetical protein AAW30_01830 [Arcobacter porcinus]